MPVEVVPVKALAMREAVSAVTKAAAADNMGAAKAAAMERGATTAETSAVKRCATTVETSTSAAVETAAAMASTTVATTTVTSTAMTSTSMTATAMTAADFARQPIGDMLRCRRRAWIDQRKRLRALAGGRRQHQGRDSRKAPTTDEATRADQATDEAASGIRNFHHA